MVPDTPNEKSWCPERKVKQHFYPIPLQLLVEGAHSPRVSILCWTSENCNLRLALGWAIMKSCSRHTYSLPIKTPFKHYRFVLLTPDHSFLWTVTSMFQYCCFLRRKFDLIDTNKIPNINIKRRFKISPEDVTTHHRRCLFSGTPGGTLAEHLDF